MIATRWTALVLFGLAMTLPVRGDDATDQKIAMKFYPPRLDANFRENHSPAVPITRIAIPLRVDLDRTGNDDYIAVAYSNGFAGALRVIKGRSLETAVLVTEAADQTMGGRGRPVLFESDIDNDGIPELMVEFPHATWIYQFQAQPSALKLWGPTLARQDGVTSYLGSATLLDVDGDGVLEIIEIDSPPGATSNTSAGPGTDLAPYTVHKVASDGTSTRTDIRLVFFDRFFGAEETQETGQPPQIQERSFAATAGDYKLRIVNGDQKRNYAVSSAEIRLNGVTILGSGDLNGKRRILTVPVTLHDVNQLTVEVRDPGSELSVIIARGL